MDQHFTHLDHKGSARMVDVTGKLPTTRQATARCRVVAEGEGLAALGIEARGVLMIQAETAGVQAAKQTSRLIPLCHPIRLESIAVRVEAVEDGFEIESVAGVHERTGVEMEALTACAAAALTLLAGLSGRADDGDGASGSIEDLLLAEKYGGRSGTWTRERALGAVPPTPDEPLPDHLTTTSEAATPTL